MISNTISSPLILDVKNCKTTKEMWYTLSWMFAHVSSEEDASKGTITKYKNGKRYIYHRLASKNCWWSLCWRCFRKSLYKGLPLEFFTFETFMWLELSFTDLVPKSIQENKNVQKLRINDDWNKDCVFYANHGEGQRWIGGR